MRAIFFLVVFAWVVFLCSGEQNVKDEIKTHIQNDDAMMSKRSSKNPNKGQHCELPLGVQDGRIHDHDITASSYSTKQEPYRGRLYTIKDKKGLGAWTAKSKSGGQWLMVNLGEIAKVTKIATQGRQDAHQWIKTYHLQYSIDGIHWVYSMNYKSHRQIFTGNNDRYSVRTHRLFRPVYARYVKFLPLSWHGHISMRVELYGCRNIQSCSIPLGMEDKRITDNAITASYYYSSYYPRYGRLNYGRAWCTGTSGGQYLQIDLGDVKTVTKVATQGLYNNVYYTRYYRLDYSVDGLKWMYHRNQDRNTKQFTGNSLQDAIHTNTLEHRIIARFVRFRPLSYYNWYCLRVELYGCKQERTCLQPLGVADYRIYNNEMTASSHGGWPAYYGRLIVHYGWISGRNDKKQWLKVDLRTIKRVTSVATQGRFNSNQWVKSYKLSYSVDGLHWAVFKENGIEKVFPGNNDRFTVITHRLHPDINARYVRFHPMSWHGHIVMRVEVYGCTDGGGCNLPVGIEDGRLEDGAITASSVANSKCTTKHARLNMASTGKVFGAWCPKSKASNQWLQIHLPHLTMVTGVSTQGRQDADQWITSYQLAYSLNGRNWGLCRLLDGRVRVFWGNSDRSSIVNHKLHQPMDVSYLRFLPRTWHKAAAMRVEVYGCRTAHHCAIPMGMEDGRIPFYALHASSNLKKYGPTRSRLYPKGKYAWCAARNNSRQWLKIDLRIPKTLTKIAIQGRSRGWVKSYTLSYSISGYNWMKYPKQSKVKVFLGNYDGYGVVQQDINPPIHARFIRIHPATWHQRICLTTELYGCLVEGIGE